MRPSPLLGRAGALASYLLVGIFFGFLLIRSEVASWYRIQEMFRFDSVHLYGVIGSAVAVAALGLAGLRRFRPKTLTGAAVEVPDKVLGSGRRYILGGTVFGLGWGLAGACPGPIYALLGSGIPGAAVLLLSALAGTWTYAALAPRLPH